MPPRLCAADVGGRPSASWIRSDRARASVSVSFGSR